MTDKQILLYERRGDTVWLTLNRPEARNPLSREMVTALRDGVERAASDTGARAIVLAGAGRVFCAGADVKQYREAADREVVISDGGLLYDLTQALTTCPLPVIARVHRAAFGGAIGLLCGADLVVADNDCTFSLSEARLGLVPAVISTTTIRALGHRNARAILVLSEPFGVEQALKVNLIQEAVPESELDAVIERWLSQIRAGAPGALADAKKLLHVVTSPDLGSEEIRRQALELAGDRRSNPEGQEGMSAFIEKRRPAWNPE